MNNRIQSQANKLWQVISSPATATTYQQMLALTWNILKETGQLLWLLLCLGLVFADWFWKKSYQTGQDARTWVSTVQTKSQSTVAGEGEAAIATSSTTFLSETGKSLLSAGQAGITLALSTAKGQLGIEAKPKPQPEPAKISAASVQAYEPPSFSAPTAQPTVTPDPPSPDAANTTPAEPATQTEE